MSRKTIAVGFVLLTLPVLLFAQGTSPLKVTAISITPATISAGVEVAISVTMQNTSRATYGCPNGTIAVYVFKNQAYLAANQIFNATQGVTPFAPGETRTVAISTHWTVPAGDVSSYHVVAWSPNCGSDEFGQTAQLTLRKSCTYSAAPLLVPNIKVPIRRP